MTDCYICHIPINKHSMPKLKKCLVCLYIRLDQLLDDLLPNWKRWLKRLKIFYGWYKISTNSRLE